MPAKILGIPETEDSITRPVALKVARDLLRYNNVPDDCRVVFQGSTGALAQQGSALDDKVGDPDTLFSHDNVLSIEVEEITSESRVLSTAVSRKEELLFFYDEALGVKLKPVYTPMEVRLSFRLRFKDKNSAMRWRQGIKTKYSAGQQVNLHEINYHYGIPNEFLYGLVKIHERREAVAGYGDDLKTWFEKMFDQRFKGLVKLDGDLDNASLVIPEKQIGVQGYYDFTYEPEKGDKAGDTAAWTCGFDYTFLYDKVGDVFMEWPLMVHNQLMPKAYRHPRMPYRVEDQPRLGGLSRMLDETSVANRLRKSNDGIEGVAIPDYDDWLPTRVTVKTTSVFRALIQVNPDDVREVLNLDDLGEWSFHDVVKNYLIAEHAYLGKFCEALFYLDMYDGDLPVSRVSVETDDQLNVRSTYDLGLRKVHHLRVAIITDLHALSERAKMVIRNDIELIKLIIDTLIPGYPVPKTLGNGLVTRRDFERLADFINQKRYDFRNMLDERMLTVGIYTIAARRLQDAAN
tara:strand:- start:185 stop:1735 length:1551 start_codon:yes stop_codon:yes gene_type:complete